MWLITTLLAAISVTAIRFLAPKKYKLDLLSFMLWGASMMIFIDHVLSYESGEFIKMETEGIITNGIVLGITMLIPILIIWEIYVIISLKRGGG
jgi:hypothetical protein